LLGSLEIHRRHRQQLESDCSKQWTARQMQIDAFFHDERARLDRAARHCGSGVGRSRSVCQCGRWRLSQSHGEPNCAGADVNVALMHSLLVRRLMSKDRSNLTSSVAVACIQISKTHYRRLPSLPHHRHRCFVLSRGSTPRPLTRRVSQTVSHAQGLCNRRSKFGNVSATTLSNVA
jgi:hypothetical protein